MSSSGSDLDGFSQDSLPKNQAKGTFHDTSLSNKETPTPGGIFFDIKKPEPGTFTLSSKNKLAPTVGGTEIKNLRNEKPQPPELSEEDKELLALGKFAQDNGISVSSDGNLEIPTDLFKDLVPKSFIPIISRFDTINDRVQSLLATRKDINAKEKDILSLLTFLSDVKEKPIDYEDQYDDVLTKLAQVEETVEAIERRIEEERKRKRRKSRKNKPSLSLFLRSFHLYSLHLQDVRKKSLLFLATYQMTKRRQT